VTAQRVASLSSSLSTPTPSVSSRAGSSSRVTSQTISSLHKQSDTSLRSSRSQLPSIAGSPSVGTGASAAGSMPPPSSLIVSSSMPKETPTKIPRITGHTSAHPSPTLKGSISSAATITSRRASTNVSAMGSVAGTPIMDASPSPSLTATKENVMDEFGVLESGSEAPSAKITATPSHRLSVRASPSTASTASRVPRQVAVPPPSTTKKNRESISFSALRKPSASSVASITSAAPSDKESRLSALSPSRGLHKLLSPKSSRHVSSASASASALAASASSSRQSLSTPSPVPTVDDEELLADEEMMQCIKRQQAKKLANGASQEEIDELLSFPEPFPPVPPSTPEGMLRQGSFNFALTKYTFCAEVLRSPSAKYLSEYERKEIRDYDKVYYIGARSHKKPATLDNSTNNYGYDDDRGDYLVVNHDHFAFRYEVVGCLGKGSFGQVLRCRDHCTGEYVAVKIIRNKKRFHQQAHVEIKLLENLWKWVRILLSARASKHLRFWRRTPRTSTRCSR
jgi:dual specificity tyrosine-phosphorylation-regulated kinase 2/3/4